MYIRLIFNLLDMQIIKALNLYRKKTGTDNFFWVTITLSLSCLYQGKISVHIDNRSLHIIKTLFLSVFFNLLEEIDF